MAGLGRRPDDPRQRSASSTWAISKRVFVNRCQRGPRAAAFRWYLRQALRTVPHAAAMRTRRFRDRHTGRERETRMNTFLQDIRYGLRSLRKSPTFTVTATLTLALAIGVNTAIFSLVSVLVFADLPMNEPSPWPSSAP